MAVELNGKTAIVTGGSSGIGLELVKKLLGNGCNVVIADLLLRDGAKEVVDNDHGTAKAIFVETDVTNWKQLQNAFDQAIHVFKRLDIVVPAAGVFEPPSSSFWYLDTGTDTVESSSYKTFDINITHPVRATQLAIDYFIRQKLGHGVVVIISSIAAQLTPLPVPMYSASKHAMSGFTRSLAHLEPGLNIRVNGVAPGCVKTPIWTADKLPWLNEEVDSWVTTSQVVETIIDLITNKEHVGGTILEVGVDIVRPVNGLNDPGPSGRGHTIANMEAAYGGVYTLIAQNFGK